MTVIAPVSLTTDHTGEAVFDKSVSRGSLIELCIEEEGTLNMFPVRLKLRLEISGLNQIRKVIVGSLFSKLSSSLSSSSTTTPVHRLLFQTASCLCGSSKCSVSNSLKVAIHRCS